MAMGGGHEPGGHTTLSEINVTPLVDVMLVLLTIFMVASSVETIQVAAEREQLLKEKKEEEQNEMLLAKLERLREQEERDTTYHRRQRRRMQFMQLQQDRLKEIEEKLEDRSQNVPIDMPKVSSEAVNLAEQKKIVVTLTRELAFYIGDTLVVDCNAPEFGKTGTGPLADTEETLAFRACLAAIEKKLVANRKLKEEGECFLRADRKLSYGRVLALMATIRKAGITKFGLVSQEEEGVDGAAR